MTSTPGPHQIVPVLDVWDSGPHQPREGRTRPGPQSSRPPAAPARFTTVRTGCFGGSLSESLNLAVLDQSVISGRRNRLTISAGLPSADTAGLIT